MREIVKVTCTQCGREIQKEKREVTRQHKRGNHKFYCDLDCVHGKLKTFDAPFNLILRQTKKSAKTKGRDWDLSLGFLKELWSRQSGECPYTGKKMVLIRQRDQSYPEAASLDRIDPAKGYAKDNVEFVCLFVNLGKRTFSKEEIQRFFKCHLTDGKEYAEAKG